MGSNNSNFWLGLGIGAVIGALAYRSSRTEEAKKLKDKVRSQFRKMNSHAEVMADAAKEKALGTGTKVADKVADTAIYVAERADEMRDKVHAAASKAGK